jgi:ribonuclease HII
MAKEKLILGIDDAGRGPVIGPMVLAGCLIKEEDAARLKELGVRDSKLLLPEKREKLFEIIKEAAERFYIVQVSAAEIDSSIRHGINLNQVEALKTAEIINYLLENEKNEVTVLIDCPSNNIPAWRNYVLDRVHENIRKRIKIQCEHKADVRYPSVSAASILAKVTRDAEIEKIKKKYDIDIGSGYPADPTCQKFLKTKGKEYQKYGIIRETWQTWKNHESGNEDKKAKQKNLADF